MASAVADVLTNGGMLLAEAGTGTGKTLAYLIPAILNRKRVLVSTGTKNLQEQIYSKDVPTLARALGVPFSATYMKGRGNYLCLHRFEQFKSEGGGCGRAAAAENRIHLTLIEEWVKRTDTGDRAEVDELPDDLPFWGEIAATTENCLGSSCPRIGDCYITRMRQRAAESDVVIVNHHLLCADAAVRHHSFGEVIPECHVLVVDEAHQLEEIATQYFGITISNFKVEELVADALRVIRVEGGHLGGDTAGWVRSRRRHGAARAAAADRRATDIRRRADSVSAEVRQLRDRSRADRARRADAAHRAAASSVNARAGFGGHEQIDMLRPGRAEIARARAAPRSHRQGEPRVLRRSAMESPGAARLVVVRFGAIVIRAARRARADDVGRSRGRIGAGGGIVRRTRAAVRRRARLRRREPDCC